MEHHLILFITFAVFCIGVILVGFFCFKSGVVCGFIKAAEVSNATPELFKKLRVRVALAQGIHLLTMYDRIERPSREQIEYKTTLRNQMADLLKNYPEAIPDVKSTMESVGLAYLIPTQAQIDAYKAEHEGN